MRWSGEDWWRSPDVPRWKLVYRMVEPLFRAGGVDRRMCVHQQSLGWFPALFVVWLAVSLFCWCCWICCCVFISFLFGGVLLGRCICYFMCWFLILERERWEDVEGNAGVLQEFCSKTVLALMSGSIWMNAWRFNRAVMMIFKGRKALVHKFFAFQRIFGFICVRDSISATIGVGHTTWQIWSSYTELDMRGNGGKKKTLSQECTKNDPFCSQFVLSFKILTPRVIVVFVIWTNRNKKHRKSARRTKRWKKHLTSFKSALSLVCYRSLSLTFFSYKLN